MIKIRLIKISLLLLSTACAQDRFALPSVNSADFHQEAKDYIIKISENQVNVDRDKPEIRKGIIEDPRDWEAASAEIIGEAERYNPLAPQVALTITKLRNKGNDPRISKATVDLIHYTIPRAIERLESGKDNRMVITGAKTRVSSLILRVLGTESSDVLQAVLEYLNSPEAERLGTLEKSAPQEIAAALQKYGDLRNAEEALKVTEKLAAMGKTDFASDIRRAAERIKKDAGKKNATTGTSSQDETNHVPGNDAEGKDTSDSTPLWPWFAAGAALIAAVLGYFRMRRTGT